MSVGAYWCLSVLTGVCGVSEGVYLYLMVTNGVCYCLWVHKNVFCCLMVPNVV